MSRSVSFLPASAAAVLRSPVEEADGAMTSLSGPIQRHSKRWQPGLADPAQHPCHNEVFASSDDASGAELALALARDALRADAQGPLQEMDDQRPILWVQTSDTIKRGGRPYIHGLPDELRRRIIHIEAKDARDALFALEEGVRCRDLAFVLGEIKGNPRELDFTASRRLTLAAQAHGSRLYLVRPGAQPDLSSARMRWKVRSAPSQRPHWNMQAPGAPTWHAQLFRARAHPPGEWVLRDEGQSLSARNTPSFAIPPAANISENTAETNTAARKVARHASSARNTAANTFPKAPENTPAHYGDMARATVGRSLAAL